MSARFAAWLRVTPAPSTLAESSAVYQALKKQGRISVFTRATGRKSEERHNKDSPSQLYYTVFPHEPLSLRTTFDVPVHHGLPSARDEDPFNIRGLQNRKPMPAPKTFRCVIERADLDEIELQKQTIVKENPYYGPFKTAKDKWLRDVLVETGAPPGVDKGLNFRMNDLDAAPDSCGLSKTPAKPSGINMGSLRNL